METSSSNSDLFRNSLGISSGSGSRRYGMQLTAANIIQAPLSALLEYSGILRPRSSHSETESLVNDGVGVGVTAGLRDRFNDNSANIGNVAAGSGGVVVGGGGGGEVSIQIIGGGEQEHVRVGTDGNLCENGISAEQILSGPAALASASGRLGEMGNEGDSMTSGLISNGDSGSGSTDGDAGNGVGAGNSRDSSYQRYDIQQVARWIEQVLPFSLLLLIVFIRQHLQGFFVTIWIAAVMFKSNDILRKQTALKGERKISVLVSFTVLFMFHVFGVYWWYRNDDLLYPLAMFPPKEIPPFWHAIFIIMVNDTMVRQAAMILKCILLMYYKNSRGRNYRKQGQLLTLVEYMLLLYRALLPAPVWYRFFLNKEYGSLFSSLTTGLYLTFKLTSVVEKVQAFFTSLKALSRKEVHYGSHATSEQVNAAGDLCAICQEKMHAPILLRCKHIFCEDCVSEWFERERTCPLCRALVKPADLKSYGDGSTCLFFQIF